VLRWNAIPTIFNFQNEIPYKRPKLNVNDSLNESIDNNSDIPTLNNHDIITDLENQLKQTKKEIQILTEQNQNLVQNLEKLFEPEQVRILKRGTSKGVNWSNECIRRSLKMYLTYGTTGYNELKQQNYPLPSIRTLQRRMQSFKCMPTLHNTIFNLLEIKAQCLLPEERHAVLLIDEMAIKPGLQFDNNSGEIVGTC
jgi:hypothetical protein